MIVGSSTVCSRRCVECSIEVLGERCLEAFEQVIEQAPTAVISTSEEIEEAFPRGRSGQC